MYKKEWITMSLYRTGIKETTKLTIPKKELDARYIVCIKHQFFGMGVKLYVEAVKFGNNKYQDKYNGYKPFYIE